MNAARASRLMIGDQVRLSGQTYTLLAVQRTDVLLGDVTGHPVVRTLAQIYTDPHFEVLGLHQGLPDTVPVPSEVTLGLLPEPVVEEGRWWERHLIQVLWGHDPQAPPSAERDPRYDPQTRSLRQRAQAKTAELSGSDRPVALSTMLRKCRQYLAGGLLGVIDRRFLPMTLSCGRADPRIVQALEQAISEEKDASTGRITRLRRRVETKLKEKHGDQAPALPARATFYRWVATADAGRHTFDSARTRRSLALQPKRPFGALDVLRPGEWMQIDSSPLNVRIMLDNGVTDKAELTWIIDCLTKSVPAAVLTASTKAADAALLLARCVTPEPMRPGWADAVRLSRSVLPWRHLTELDDRLTNAAARPVLRPENIVYDHGSVYLSKTFSSGCLAMGANAQPTRAGSPFQKGVVERSFGSVDTLFAQFVKGYTGSRVEHRGKDPDADAIWPIHELQELLNEWIVTTWQTRPHDGIRLPSMPGVALTPNEACAVYLETAGYVPIPLTTDDYLNLMPALWRVIRPAGVQVGWRTYDAPELVPYRRRPSGVTAHRGLWEVRYDPYDVSRIWIRDRFQQRWIIAYWKHLTLAKPHPFGEDIWIRARQILVERGTRRPTEEQIAAAADDLLTRAEHGPQPTRGPAVRDARLAGRNRNTTPHPADLPTAEPQQPAPPTAEADDEEQHLGDVIPLRAYDARQQVQRWN